MEFGSYAPGRLAFPAAATTGRLATGVDVPLDDVDTVVALLFSTPALLLLLLLLPAGGSDGELFLLLTVRCATGFGGMARN